MKTKLQLCRGLKSLNHQNKNVLLCGGFDKLNHRAKWWLSLSKPLLAIFALLFISCYEPSPLYGTWADNDGNKISFVSDGTFNAYVLDSVGDKVNYEGNWSVIDNVLVFSFTSSKVEGSFSTNTTWDIRGSVLYLSWTYPDETENTLTTKQVILYHTSK